MEIDAEIRRQILVSVAAGGLFLALLVWIGSTFNGAEGLSEGGALALVGALVFFVLVMAVAGAYLARK